MNPKPLNPKPLNPYESPESAESKAGKRRIPLFTIIGVALILVGAGVAAVFMGNSVSKPDLMLRRGPVPKKAVIEDSEIHQLLLRGPTPQDGAIPKSALPKFTVNSGFQAGADNVQNGEQTE